jgi:hypothetical protein
MLPRDEQNKVLVAVKVGGIQILLFYRNLIFALL